MVIKDFGMPFNDVASDRLYSAADWQEYFKSLVGNGVVGETGNELAIIQQTVPNKSIIVSTGAVAINGAMRVVDVAFNLTLADNTSGNPRIDRIVARLNTTDRKLEILVKQGTPGASPSAPALTQDATTWEISIAKILLANGFSSVVTANITDERTYMSYKDRVLNDRVDAFEIAIDSRMDNLEDDVAAAVVNMNNSITPSGCVIAFAGAASPVGYLECNGSTVNRTTYANLFTAIGTTYGIGDGSTTFALPDLRGEFVRGWDHGRGIDSGRAIGASQSASDFSVVSSGSNNFEMASGAGYNMYKQNDKDTDGGLRPRNIALMYCIKI